MYLCQHGVTRKYVSTIEIVIIGGAQFKHVLNIGTVPLYNYMMHFESSAATYSNLSRPKSKLHMSKRRSIYADTFSKKDCSCLALK